MNSNQSGNKVLQNHMCMIEKCSQRFDAYKENIFLRCFGCKQQFYAQCFEIEYSPTEQKQFFADSHVQFICFDCFQNLKGVNKTEVKTSSPVLRKKYKTDAKEKSQTNTDLKSAAESTSTPVDLMKSEISKIDSANKLKPSSIIHIIRFECIRY